MTPRRTGRGGHYPPSRLSAKIARRLIEEHGVKLTCDPKSYSITVCWETVRHNIAEGMNYNQWSLREYDWSPIPYHSLARVLIGEREVEVEIGGSISAAVLAKREAWSVEYHPSQAVIRIEPSTKEHRCTRGL